MKRLIPLLLLIGCNISQAESGAYLVEVIIFRNLEAIAEPVEVDQLRSFAQYPELVAPVTLKDQQVDTQTASKNLSSRLQDNPLPLQLENLLRADLPDDLSVIEDRGSYMDDVWRRLRSSRAYRPLHFSAWQQNRVDYYPPLRIHNEIVLDTGLESPTGLMVADLTADDPLAAYRQQFYQLDGSVQLRRSRFLHIYLDIEYREKAIAVEPEPDFFSPVGASEFQETPAVKTPAYVLYSLKQNRPVRSGQLQYFDTPYFGALVFVTSINEK